MNDILKYEGQKLCDFSNDSCVNDGHEINEISDFINDIIYENCE